ncbi:hypothetical protein GWO09_30890 [candidate division KSB1 bacterium]|nr:hypothetical protein [candidate division KSB1 bacterium]
MKRLVLTVIVVASLIAGGLSISYAEPPDPWPFCGPLEGIIDVPDRYCGGD